MGWHPMDAVYLPLFGRDGDTIGLVCLDDPLDGKKPTAEGLQLIDVFAQEAALVVEMARLHEETRYLQSFNENIVRTVAEAIILFDRDGRVTFANPAAQKLWGYSVEGFRGHRWISLVPASELAQIEELIRGALSHPLGRKETLIVNKWGQTVPTISSARRLLGDGDEWSTLVTFTDIRERKDAEDALQRRTDELESRNEELSAFGHTVAHDLKAPLGYVVGFSQILLDEYDDLLPDERDRGLLAIAKGGRKVANISDELLLLSNRRTI